MLFPDYIKDSFQILSKAPLIMIGFPFVRGKLFIDYFGEIIAEMVSPSINVHVNRVDNETGGRCMHYRRVETFGFVPKGSEVLYVL